jgi:membrane associated rhomboid family serine protease
VAPERRRADEWATVLAASGIPHRLRSRLDGWALIVASSDVEAAREALDAYDRENTADTAGESGEPVAPVRGAAAVGVAVALLLIGFFAVAGTRANRSAWFERGSADAARIVAGEWWRTVTALTLHADAPHVVGNAVASVVLVGALSHQVGPGIALWLVLLAGTAGNALTAVAHGTQHDSVGASTAMFGAIGILAATRVIARGRYPAARKRWMIVARHEPGRRSPRSSIRPPAWRRSGCGRCALAAAVFARANAMDSRRGRSGACSRRMAARDVLRPHVG